MASGIGAIASGWFVVYQKIANDFPINRNPLLVMTAMLITTTVQFILMGLLAELLVRTYHESQNRPTYVIKQILESTTNACPRESGQRS